MFFAFQNSCYLNPDERAAHMVQLDMVLYLIDETQVNHTPRKKLSILWPSLLFLFSSGEDKYRPSFLTCFAKRKSSFLSFTSGSVCTEVIWCSNSKVSWFQTREMLYVQSFSFWLQSNRIRQNPLLSLTRVCLIHYQLEPWKGSIGVILPS